MKLFHTASVLLSFSLSGLTRAFTNPLKSSDGGDPHIVYHEGWYYLMATNFVDLRMTRATSLEGLKQGEMRTVWTSDDPSRCCNVWAPEMHFLDGSWHIYFAAGPGGADRQRAYALKGGVSPWDAFTFEGQMRNDWSIDGTHLQIDNQDYFVYSGFTTEGVQSLFIAPLTSPSTTGESRLLSMPTEQWETVGMPVNEGAFALYREGKTMLSFSASYCGTSSYALGLLTYNGGDPMDSANWSKSGPVFSTTGQSYGPGHNSFFQSPNGQETWNVFHSTPNSNGNCGGERVVNAQIVSWKADGSPDFGSPLPAGTEIDEPQ